MPRPALGLHNGAALFHQVSSGSYLVLGEGRGRSCSRALPGGVSAGFTPSLGAGVPWGFPKCL